jgi:hypothetical protein
MLLQENSIVIPIPLNTTNHPNNNKILGFYIKYTNGKSEYINIDHPDELKNNLKIDDLVFSEKSLILNKKLFMYNGIHGGLDLNSYMHYYFDDIIDYTAFYPKTVEYYVQKYYYMTDLFKIVPLSKLLEYADNISEYILNYYKPDKISHNCISYCNDFSEVFHFIEKTKVLMQSEMKDQFYNWQTLTTRPSNTWNNINFSALNKTNGIRNTILSRFNDGKIVQFDYDAFHIKLLSTILNYEFSEHPYESIRKDLNLNIDYDKIKLKVFQNIYGTMLPEFLKHPFFNKIKDFSDKLYLDYVKNQKIESLFYQKKFRSIDDPSPTKVFNYALQSLETEYNVKKLKSIINILKDKQSKLILYLYDAFVFDIHPDETDLIELLKKCFETDNMTIKVYAGESFGTIKRI